MRRFVFTSRSEEPERGRSRVTSLVIRLAINAVALWVAARLISGIEIEGWGSLLAVAVIFGFVNAVIKPVVHILGCPLTCLTFGIFALVINAAMLALTAWIAGLFDLNMSIDGFWPALWGALLISIVSAILSAIVGKPRRRPRHQN